MREVTGAIATINICGPKAREVLQSVSDTDVSNAAFPFLAVRGVEIGFAQRAGRAHRLCRRAWL